MFEKTHQKVIDYKTFQVSQGKMHGLLILPHNYTLKPRLYRKVILNFFNYITETLNLN